MKTISILRIVVMVRIQTVNFQPVVHCFITFTLNSEPSVFLKFCVIKINTLIRF